VISPGWLAAALTVVVLGVAAFSAVRLAGLHGRRWRGELDADVAHLLMGVAMAGMLLPRLRTLPAGAWDIVFAAAAAWFGWRAIRAHRARLASRADQSSPSNLSCSSVSRSSVSRPSVSRSSVSRPSVSHPSLSHPNLTRPSSPASSISHAGHTGLTASAGLGRGLTGFYCRHPLPHLIDCLAMLFMLWAGPALAAGAAGVAGAAGAGMAGMGGAISGARLPALVLALCICGYIVWLGDRIQLLALAAPGAGQAAQGGHRLVLAPRLGTCCKIAMGVAMGVMLIDLI
jgi:hypothetical protein